jgi:ribosomal protein S18 acetylase RimI-like enzyme
VFELPTTLLVRRAAPPGTASLLAAAGLTADAVDSAAAAGQVFVLGEVSQPPTTPPLAALAVDFDGRGRALVAGIAVIAPLRRRGLASRLLTDTITLLQADGVLWLEATLRPDAAIGKLLRSAGFTLDARYGGDAGERFVREL